MARLIIFNSSCVFDFLRPPCRLCNLAPTQPPLMLSPLRPTRVAPLRWRYATFIQLCRSSAPLTTLAIETSCDDTSVAVGRLYLGCINNGSCLSSCAPRSRNYRHGKDWLCTSTRRSQPTTTPTMAFTRWSAEQPVHGEYN